MPGQTTLHGWTVPRDGDDDYEDSFEQFFTQIDNGVEIRDVEANLSNYNPESGAKFVATDTENEFIGDGNAWNKIQSSGKNPTLDSLESGNITGKSSGATVYDDNTNTVGDGTTSAEHDSLSAEETLTERINNSAIHYVEDYPGSDADARLTNAIDAASDGESLHLGQDDYSEGRTITKPLVFEGTSGSPGLSGPRINGSAWTCDAKVTFKDIYLRESQITLNVPGSSILNCGVRTSGNEITLAADQILVNGVYGASGDIVFASGTGGGLVDTAAGSVTVTDNGSNSIGDV